MTAEVLAMKPGGIGVVNAKRLPSEQGLRPWILVKLGRETFVFITER
ncbi:hypothetical protein JQR84_15455 [Pseudomonas luteola]|nr:MULTISPECIES: hypothetical protein [Pseudomonas]MBA1248494.1 hypothetical protein [Pseudomonas zeshuii]